MTNFLPLAAAGDLSPLIILIVPVLALMIPIVRSLLSHQQKMAEILRSGTPNDAVLRELAEMRREMSELKQVVNQQTIALDDASSLRLQSPPPLSEDMRQRIG